MVLFSAMIGTITCSIVVAAATWAIFYIHQDRSHLKRVTGRIISVDGSKRSSFGRSIHFGTYSLTVQYRDSDGQEVKNWLDKRTYGFPSKGDSITLLIDPDSGRIEASPFPELWIVLVLVYAGMGWLIRFFITFWRWELRGERL
jgi:hypothetical protein